MNKVHPKGLRTDLDEVKLLKKSLTESKSLPETGILLELFGLKKRGFCEWH